MVTPANCKASKNYSTSYTLKKKEKRKQLKKNFEHT